MSMRSRWIRRRRSSASSSPSDLDVEILAATVVPAARNQADLSSAFNRTGIVTDGTPFTGGLDGAGDALSSSLLGPTLMAGGATFDLGPAGADDAVSAAGQVIALPPGTFGSLALLGTGVKGDQPDQTFTVTYTDGSTETFQQSISDWASPQGYSGESTALTMPYRDTSGGSADATSGPFQIYDYTFALVPKTVRSITLPTDGNVEILGVDEIP